MNPAHWNGVGDWTSSNGGPDFCYQGRCSDSGNGDPNCATRQNARAWFTWFVRQSGMDGFRFDDVKGYPPEVVEDLLYNAMGDRRDFFCVGEYVTSSSADIDALAQGTSDRSGAFDYPLRWELANLVASNGFYDIGHLPSVQQQDRFKTVPFVNNHDNHDSQVGTYIDPNNPRTPLAYAFAITIDGSPQFYYPDFFTNWWASPSAANLAARPWIANLLWCHQKLAFKSGDYFVRYQDSQQLLILERGARAIVAINNDGSAWHDAWISTAFPPNTQLHDYSGSRRMTSGPTRTAGCKLPFPRYRIRSGAQPASPAASSPRRAAPFSNSKWTTIWETAIPQARHTAEKSSPAPSGRPAPSGPLLIR